MTTAQKFGKAATVQFKTRSPVFVLDAPSFQHLQVYLQAATSLPSTEQKFKDHFTKEHFDVYFENDKPLYEDLQKILIAISIRCGAFQDVLIPVMLVLASNISKFASEANTQYDTIRAALVIATAPNARLTTKAVKDAYNEIGDELESLISNAETRGKECVELASKLNNFRRETVSDKDTLDPLHARFAKVIPDGEEVSKAMDRITNAAVAEAEKQGDIARAARKKTDESGFGLPAWALTIMFPRMGYSPVRDFYEIEQEVKFYEKAYDTAVRNSNTKKVNLKNGLVHVKLLTTALTTICGTIADAIKCIEGMTKVFTGMKSSFDQIKEQLQKVDTATHKPSMEDRCRLLKKEFEKPVAMWTKVSEVAEEFATNGNIFKAQE